MSRPVTAIRQFAGSSLTMLVIYAGSTGMNFLVGVTLARLLGVADYGTYALAMTVATLAGMAAEFGLPTLAMRETAVARATGDWGAMRALLGWADRAILLASLLLALGFFAAYGLVPMAQPTAFLAAMAWGVVLIPLVGIGKLRSLVLLALDRSFASQLPGMILRPALFVAGCLGLWASSGALDAAGAMAMQVASGAVVMLVSLAWFRRHRPAALMQAQPALHLRRWLASCLPMGLTEGLRLLQGQLALLVLGLLASSAAAGAYRVADAVAQITLVVSSVVSTAATPLFARLHGEGDRQGIERVAVLATWAMVGSCIVLGLPLALWGAWIFPLVFGPEFAGSAPVFIILWLGGLVAALCGPVLTLANMTGHHRLTTGSFGLIALLNLGLGLWLIPRFGAQGAALATVVSLAIGTIAGAMALHRLAGVRSGLFNRQAASILVEELGVIWGKSARAE